MKNIDWSDPYTWIIGSALLIGLVSAITYVAMSITLG